jgi:hypothetical protein
LATARVTIRSIWGHRRVSHTSIGAGGSFITLAKSVPGVSPSNGRRPASIWYARTPTE